VAEEVLVGDQLTPEMIQSGAGLVEALDRLGVIVKGAFWLLSPSERAWRLVIATPEVRTVGPKAIYRKVHAAYTRMPAGIPPVASKDVTVLDDKQPLYQLLRSAVATGPGISGIRFSQNVINGHRIEDAYLYRMT
jgi:hypothetical protein